jgi:geranylgeranyl pyrophosphate synthase
MEYALLSEGKRLRPMLTILSAEAVGGNQNKVMPLALAFELMHTATLVHDDVIDQDETRRNKPALYKKWSINDAILTGDALIALSVELASKYGEETLKTVARSALELCDGERMDITSSVETTTEESYFKRIREKSASLFRASTYCGALVGGGTASEVDALSAFGENFGIAYQLKDDILDLTHRGTDILKDQKSGNITLPLIHFYMNSSPNQRKELESKLTLIRQNRNTDDAELSRTILETIRRTGSIEYCEKKINEHLDRAVASISSLKNSDFKDYLIEMTEILRSQN